MEGITIRNYKFLNQIHSTSNSELFTCRRLDNENHKNNSATTATKGEDEDIDLSDQNEDLVVIKVVNKCDFNSFEGEIGLKVDHQNVSNLIEIFEHENRIFLVMNYFNNGSLQDYIELNGRISEKESLKIFQQVLNGVEYLHSLHIMHRDLKLANIMLTDYGDCKQCKIIDFGLSVQNTNLEHIENNNRKDNSSELRNEICGTLEFLPPEMILGEYYDDRVDVWSLGVILFYMLNGHCPFTGKNLRVIRRQIIYGQPQFVQTVSDEVADLVEKMLAKKKEERPSVLELKKTCNEILMKIEKKCGNTQNYPSQIHITGKIIKSNRSQFKKVQQRIVHKQLNCAIVA